VRSELGRRDSARWLDFTGASLREMSKYFHQHQHIQPASQSLQILKNTTTQWRKNHLQLSPRKPIIPSFPGSPRVATSPIPSFSHRLRTSFSESKIQKRPLLHPAIASPRASSFSPKIVYVSASSPFISIVKRVRKNLAAIEARSAWPINLHHPSKDVLQQVHDGVKAARKGRRDGGGAEEVILKGTGKAIEKVLSLAAWFQDEAQDHIGVKVALRTSSVGAIDDVVPRGEGQNAEGAEDNADGDETRIRRVSCLEVGISLR
jgi:ribonuclease P/MRP protein subunit POP7